MLARFPLPNQDQSKSHHTRRGPPYRSTGPRNLSAQLHKFVYSMRVFDLNAAAPQRLFLVTKQWKIKTGADSLAGTQPAQDDREQSFWGHYWYADSR